MIQADDTYNQVVIVGTSADRAAMVRTIESFDTDGMKGMTFGFFRLEHVSADKLITELKSVFQPPIELIGSRVRLVPMERIQTILGIAPNRSDLEVVETWIRRLDVSDNTGEQKLFVYNVQNGSAKEIAASLQSVMMSGDYGASARQVPMARTAAAPRSDGTLTRSDSTSTTTDGRPEVARVGQSRIVASEENNSLLIFGTERDYRVLREALAKLDILPRQVLIEAILAEVTLGDDLRYGVQWFFDSAVSRTTLTPDESGAVGSSFPGFSYLYSGLTNARVVINALQSRTNVNVLSAPRLAVLNNQKASLQVGDQVPIRTQVSQGTAAAGAPVVSTIQMQDTGVILDVTPRVNDNGNVILDVTQEVSDVTTTTSSSIDSPTIQRRRLRSVIATRDGATVALGGLIRENKSRGRSGVPLLQDIPWVGNLFSASNITTRRTELIVLLVPHVMRDAAETQVVVDALINGAKSAAEVASHATPLVQKPQD